MPLGSERRGPIAGYFNRLPVAWIWPWADRVFPVVE